MDKLMIKGIGVLLFLGLCSTGQTANQLQSTAVMFNKNTSVRAAGMGDVQTAVQTDEAGAISWNPAGLQNLHLPEVFAAYSAGLMDESFGTLNFAMPLQDRLNGGLCVMYYDAGTFDWNDEAGETTVVSAQRDMLAAGTVAYQIEGQDYPLAVGANFKLLSSTLLSRYTAYAAAFDLGATVAFPKLVENLQVGMALRNLGAPMHYLETADPLPSLALLGAAYTLPINANFSAMLAGDCQYDLDHTLRGGVGTEMRISKLIDLRLGYKFGYDLEAMTLGLGFSMANIQVDYAFSPMQALNSLHRISVKYSFAQTTTPKPEDVNASVSAATISAAENLPTAVTEAKPKITIEKIPADIVEIQRLGGRVAKVILNIGSEQRIKVGYQGTIQDANKQPLAGIVIRQVDPKLCLAEVIGLSKDFQQTATAAVERPISK